MDIKISKVTVESALILSAREVELLHHVSSYDMEKFAKERTSGHYHGGVTADEIVKFFKTVREKTGQLMHRANEKVKLFKE